MTNIQRFDRYRKKIFQQLRAAFPRPVDIDVAAVVVTPHHDDMRPRDRYQFLFDTLRFLRDEGLLHLGIRMECCPI